MVTVQLRHRSHYFGQLPCSLAVWRSFLESSAVNQCDSASIPAVMQYLRTAEACGVDVEPHLLQAGIDPALLKNAGARITGAQMESLLSSLIPASGDPLFGLHNSRSVDAASYSVLGYISMNSATLREVLRAIPVYEPIVGDMGTSSTEIFRDHAMQYWHCNFTNPVARRHEIETVLASWNTYAERFLGFDKVCDGVYFEHAAPDNPDLIQEYREIFGCEPSFDQPRSGLRIPRELLDHPLPQADEQLLQTLREHATNQLVELHHSQPLVNQVKNLIRFTLREHTPSSTAIAEKLGISSRTLQRKLNDEGLHYKDLLNEVRLDLALHYLKNTKLPVEEIAFQLGYSEARSFYRSFKQWTGRTAGSFRQEDVEG